MIQWNLHEPMPGTYNFEERLDVEAFIKMAQVFKKMTQLLKKDGLGDSVSL